ncbi:hypothetical protein GCM10011588_39650 [Nocardia jinanensis]|uniref:Uncharacterized protein n=1 Tax=Nocardia jinanensis TaxID=382504 RepID=A0A917RRH9_9NOCA|nr:hypothetical protein GCM10011588_39650 [Nocardia jinanensis]
MPPVTSIRFVISTSVVRNEFASHDREPDSLPEQPIPNFEEPELIRPAMIRMSPHELRDPVPPSDGWLIDTSSDDATGFCAYRAFTHGPPRRPAFGYRSMNMRMTCACKLRP